MIKNTIKSIRDYFKGLFNEQEKTVNLWRKDNGEQLRYKYNLNQNSVVFDLGGYTGQWTYDIWNKYHCNIYIFEPVKTFFDKILNRFENNNKIKAFNLGLSNEDKEMDISVDDDASSLYVKGEKTSKIKLKKASNFIKENKINNIDLIKINIEGGEYDLMDELISSGMINQIDNVQIQFHHFIDNAKERMMKIQKELEKTHHLTYQYKFVWENWEKNKI